MAPGGLRPTRTELRGAASNRPARCGADCPRDSYQQFAAYMGRAISTVVRYELSRPPKRNGLRRRYVGGAPRSSARPTRGRHGRLPGRPRRGFSGAVGDRVFHESRRRGWTRWRPRRAWRWLTVRRSFAASAAAMARGVQGRSGGRCNSRRTRLRPTTARLPAAAPRFPQRDLTGQFVPDLMRWCGESIKTTAGLFCTIKLGTARGFCANRVKPPDLRPDSLLGRFSGKTNSNERKKWKPIHGTLSFPRTEDVI